LPHVFDLIDVHTNRFACNDFKDFSKMSRIGTNPVKLLHICDFEANYWAEVRQQKQSARRSLYKAPSVTC